VIRIIGSRRVSRRRFGPEVIAFCCGGTPSLSGVVAASIRCTRQKPSKTSSSPRAKVLHRLKSDSQTGIIDTGGSACGE
jgi:hypothetical protein